MGADSAPPPPGEIGLKSFVCLMENVVVYTIQSSNYFVANSKKFDNSCFENFMPASSQLGQAVAAIL